MSSQGHNVCGASSNINRIGEIELTGNKRVLLTKKKCVNAGKFYVYIIFLISGRFSEQMAQLCMNSDYSDVVFYVENQKLYAHRVILAARCEYFRALLFGGLSESSQSEIVLNIPLEAFKALLRYIYSGHMSLSQMKEENILDTLGLANQYGFTELESSISEYLRLALSINNVCAILDAAK